MNETAEDRRPAAARLKKRKVVFLVPPYIIMSYNFAGREAFQRRCKSSCSMLIGIDWMLSRSLRVGKLLASWRDSRTLPNSAGRLQQHYHATAGNKLALWNARIFNTTSVVAYNVPWSSAPCASAQCASCACTRRRTVKPHRTVSKRRCFVQIWSTSSRGLSLRTRRSDPRHLQKRETLWACRGGGWSRVVYIKCLLGELQLRSRTPRWKGLYP